MEAEREQVEWVFGLTGGELSDSAWHYVHESWGLSTDPDNEHMPRDTHGRTTDPEHIRAGAFRYWYDGAPEWTGNDHTERGSTTDADGRDVRTAVVCALYGMPPAILWDARDGARWERVAFYSSSGETECPGRDDTDGPTAEDDGRKVGKVTRTQARLTDKLPSHIRDHTGKPYPRRAECVLCGERIGKPHRYIYLGDGWGEAVYVRMTPVVVWDLDDHGVSHSQYFQGAGVAHTPYTACATGIGESAHAAACDALDNMADALPDGIDIPSDLDAAADKLSHREDAHADCDTTADYHADDCEMYHRVTVRWRIDKH